MSLARGMGPWSCHDLRPPPKRSSQVSIVNGARAAPSSAEQRLATAGPQHVHVLDRVATGQHGAHPAQRLQSPVRRPGPLIVTCASTRSEKPRA